MISMDRDAIDYSPKWVSAIYVSVIIYGLESKKSRQSKGFYSTWSTAGNLKFKVNE